MNGMTPYDPESGEIIRIEPMNGPYRWSQPCDKLFAAMAEAQASLENVEKGGTNPAFRSKYAKLGAVLDEVRPKFAACGITIAQMPINGEGANIGVVTLLAHKSGQWMESTLYVAPTKFDAQGAGSVITYLRRYALMAVAGVAPDDDDDGNAAVGRPSENASGGQRAQGSTGVRGGFNPTKQVAAAPSDAKAEASRRVKEIQDAIAAAETIPDVRSLDGCPAWLAMQTLVRNTASSPSGAETVFTTLRNRIEDRVAYLEDGANG